MNKKTIIAIHGAGMTGAAWGALAEHIPLRTLTLPGHGADPTLLSIAGTARASIAEMAAWVEKQINEPCILLGHSMGALVALEAAGSPAVKGIALLGAAATMPVHPDLLKQARENPEAAAALVLKWSVFPGHPQAAEIKTSLQTVMKDGLGALAGDLAACDLYADGEVRAKSLNKPVLIVAGAEDRMIRKDGAEAFGRLFPQARFVSLPGTGHMAMAENPGGTAAALEAFLSEVSGG